MTFAHTVSAKAENAGRNTADALQSSGHTARRKARQAVRPGEDRFTDTDKVVLALLGTLLAVGAGVGGWFLWKKREDEKKKTAPGTIPPAGVKK